MSIGRRFPRSEGVDRPLSGRPAATPEVVSQSIELSIDSSIVPRRQSIKDYRLRQEGLAFDEKMMLRALRQLLLQGAVRVAIAAIATASLVGILYLITTSFQPKKQSVADATLSSSVACVPSHCRAKATIMP